MADDDESPYEIPSGPGAEAVVVVVRMRPFNTKEKTEKRGPCIDLDYRLKQVIA